MEGSSRISVGTSAEPPPTPKEEEASKLALAVFCFVVVLALGLKRWDLARVLEERARNLVWELGT